MPSTDNFKINTAVVRPDRHQDSVSAMANTLRNQEIHMETSLVEMKRQSGTPLLAPSTTSQESSSGGDQRANWLSTSIISGSWPPSPPDLRVPSCTILRKDHQFTAWRNDKAKTQRRAGGLTATSGAQFLTLSLEAPLP
jgi:hypothetical protein